MIKELIQAEDVFMKCIGVYHDYIGDYRLYYDLKHDEYFVLLPSFKITRQPGHISQELKQWCDHMIKSNKGRKFATE